MSRLTRPVVLALTVCALLVPSAAAATPRATTLGRQLVDRFLSDIRHHSVGDLRKFLSPAFQIQRADGSRFAKAAYLRNLPDVRSDRVRGLTATLSGNTLVATYLVAANEVIGGKLYKVGFEPRLSVFVRSPAGVWRMAAHANFNAPA